MKFTKKVIDGTLGLAPYTAALDQKDENFLLQLKQNGYIDQLVFSIYMKMSDKTESHLKLGGYDEEGCADGVAKNPNFKFIKTESPDSWRVSLRGAKLYEDTIELGDRERFVLFELAYPFSYIPLQDFEKVADVINAKYGGKDICQKETGKCQIATECDQIEKQPGAINITLTDGDGRDVKISFDHDTMFLDSTHAKLATGKKCFIPIIGYGSSGQAGATDDTWFLG